MACRAEGSPTPTIKWFKDGHQMKGSPRFDVRPDGSLVVQNVSEQDQGMYSCIADNGVERRSAEARLTIRQTRETTSSQNNLHNNVAYRIGNPSTATASGDEFVVVALEEATLEVDKAIKMTIDNLFSGSRSLTNSTPSELLRIFRYPPESQRDLAKSAEIYERTLRLVAEKVHNKSKSQTLLEQGDQFKYSVICE